MTIRTLDAKALSLVLHKTPETIACDLSRAPHRLPPPIRVAGTRPALWLESSVLSWLQDRQIGAMPKRGRPTKRQQIERAKTNATNSGGEA